MQVWKFLSALKGNNWPSALMAEEFRQGGPLKSHDVGKDCS